MRNIVLPVAIASLVIFSGLVGAAEFGETCNAETVCDPTQYLQCIDTKCACADPAAQFFESYYGPPTNKGCRVAHGKNCSTATPTVPCSNGATCGGPDNVCQCANNIFPPPNEELSSCRGSFNSDCVSELVNPCNLEEGLVCVMDSATHGNCRCKERHAWEDSSKTCKVPVGESCEKNFNATDPTKNVCLVNAHCILQSDDSRLCDCKPGYSEARDGTCKAAYGQVCSTGCNNDERLTCIDEICDCNAELNYDVSTGTCVAQAGAYCTDLLGQTDKFRLTCGNLATCTNYGIDFYGECRCNEGASDRTLETGLHVCVQDYGQVCTVTAEASKDTCDHTANLRCYDGSCRCKPGLWNKDGKCLIKNGGPCDDDNDCDANSFMSCSATLDNPGSCFCSYGLSYEEEQDSCVSRRQCHLLSEATQAYNPIIKCAKGMKCIKNNTSDDHTGLCQCESDHMGGEDGCYPSYGKACIDNTPNMSCDIKGNLACMGGFCRCKPGFWESGTGVCSPMFGRPCSTSLHCDETAFLTCDFSNTNTALGTCNCSDPIALTYDNSRHACVSRDYCHLQSSTNFFFLTCANGNVCQPFSTDSINGIMGTCSASISSLTTLLLFTMPLFIHLASKQ